MKKTFLLILLISAISFSQAQTVDEIIESHIVANGGAEKFAALKSLQYTSIVKLNMMNMQIDLNSSNYIRNKKLYRKEISGMMGMKGSYTLITDTAGYVSIPAVRGYGDFPGIEGGLNKMDADALQKAQQKLDIMQEFSALITQKSSGAKAELLGTTKVDKVECFKIKLTTTDGESSLYFVDANTFLIKQIEVSGKQISALLGFRGGPMGDMMGGRMDKQKMLMMYKEYTDVGGIKFPSKLLIQLGANDVEIENSSIEINVAIDLKWYKAN